MFSGFYKVRKRQAQPPQTGQLPLNLVRPGKRLKLLEIKPEHGLRHRLTELGLTPGVEFEVLQSNGGPLLLAIHDSRLAVGQKMAQNILVKIRE